MGLQNIFLRENIITDFSSGSKKEAIEKLAEHLFNCGYLVDDKVFVENILERESYATTGIGNGLAIPHGKGTTVKEVTLVFAKTSQPIDWDSLDNEPIDKIFLMAIPQTAKGNEHLKMLAELSRKLMNEEFIDSLNNEQSIDGLLEILKS